MIMVKIWRWLLTDNKVKVKTRRRAWNAWSLGERGLIKDIAAEAEAICLVLRIFKVYRPCKACLF